MVEQSSSRNERHTELEISFLSIKDKGPGIKAHDLPRIFDKGFTGGTGRIHNAATGLGLYLAQTVATKIGITLADRRRSPENEMTRNATIGTMTFSQLENDFDIETL